MRLLICLKDIKEGKYQAIIINPEILMKNDGDFEKLFPNQSFKQNIIAVVFDEAHCISKWGSFWSEYHDVGRLQYYLLKTPFYATSATLSQRVYNDVTSVLHMHHDNTMTYFHSNDHFNVFLAVQKLAFSAKSFKDLEFLIPKKMEGRKLTSSKISYILR